jgi:general secretion pathway protein A
MYESHFGFSSSPFQLNPDPSFYFDSRGHSNALSYLKFGSHQGEGFIVVTGEIGAGKTTLVRTLLDGLDPTKVVAAQVVSTQLESNDLLLAILMAFGVASSKTSKAHLIASLEAFLTGLAAKGRRALLIIDEAQNLSHEAVEELRMLSNFQLGNHGLLQSFLVGQPELRGLLQSKSMEQLRQRVIASCHLGPLDPAETRAYVEHRLRLVGWTGDSPQFPAEALDRIHHWTGGVPRRVNRLCNRLLLGAFLSNAKLLSIAMVDETALELKHEIGEAVAGPLPLPQLRQPRPAESAEVAVSAPAPTPSRKRAQPDPRETEARSKRANASVVDGARAHRGAGATPRVPSNRAQPPAAHANEVDRGPASTSKEGARIALATSGTPSSPNHSPLPSPRSIARRVHRPMAGGRPLICLIDSPAGYLMAGALARAFEPFASLPRVIAVHAGAESDLGIDDLAELKLPLPDMAIHLGIARASFAARSSVALEAFDSLFTEFQPHAVMVLGSSDAEFTCALLARKRGIPLLRAGSGRRDSDCASISDANAVLIERIADINYTDSAEAFYALYREGIRLDRVHSVGSLDRETLNGALVAAQAVPSADGLPSNFGVDVTAGGYGVITIDPSTGFANLGDLNDAVDLFCELSQETRLVWLLPPGGMAMIEALHRDKRIAASRLRPVEVGAIAPALRLLRGARCAIVRTQGPWLEESKALTAATLILAEDLSLLRVGAPAQQRPGPRGPASLEEFRRLLGAQRSSPPSPDYWDTGTAMRIANHLVSWLSTPDPVGAKESPQRKSAQTEPELAVV